MSVTLADRVVQTTTVTGTGPATPSGTVAAYDTFASRYTAGAIDIPYLIEAIDTSTNLPTGQWESGLGSWNGTALTRTTVSRSSSGAAAVNFTAGTKLISCALNELALAQLILEKALAAIESSHAAMGTVLLADLPATPAAGTADQVISVQKSSTDKRRILLITDGTGYQFENGESIIDKSLDESTDMILAASFASFSTGVIVIPGKLIGPRREFDLEFDVNFQTANVLNMVQVDIGGTPIYSPPGATSNRRNGHLCRFWMNTAGNGFRPAGSLSGFGYGANSGGGFQTVTAYTPGADLTLTISAQGVVGETCRLWRWRLKAVS